MEARMKTRGAVSLIFSTWVLASFAASQVPDDLPLTYHPATDVYDGWRLGVQAWTFNRFTFFEAVEKVASLGLDWIEAYPGQPVSKDRADMKLDYSMPPEVRTEVKQKLDRAGVKLVNYGVVRLPNDEAESRKIFDFAEDMGVETIVSEPREDAFDLIERLCEEYKIRVAIHNHPKPSRYWNPETVLKVCEGRSEWIGACGDTGHWLRSGVDPVDALKKLEGRIISLHLKDLNEFGQRDAHDVPWGTGKADIGAILSELDRQNFKGVFSVEYEHHWEDNVPEVRQCIRYFNQVASGLKPSGWQDLLALNLSDWRFKPDTWTLEKGVLTRLGGDYIWTEDQFGDFILDIEFKLAKGTNSGVFLRAGDIGDYVQSSIEVQIHETTDGSKHGACGAIYDCLSPKRKMVRKPGEWNHYTITCKADRIHVVLNGEQIIDMDLSLWSKPHENPDGTRNKFRTAIRDMPRIGHIGLQDHGQPIGYRNIRIRELKSTNIKAKEWRVD